MTTGVFQLIGKWHSWMYEQTIEYPIGTFETLEGALVFRDNAIDYISKIQCDPDVSLMKVEFEIKRHHVIKDCEIEDGLMERLLQPLNRDAHYWD